MRKFLNAIILIPLGVIFVVVILFMPYGIVPGVRQLWERLRKSSRSAGAPNSGAKIPERAA